MKINIKCPICSKSLIINNKTYICDNNHCFDLSKDGYVNLSHHSLKIKGDNDELVNSRNNFLRSDNYLLLRNKLNEIINNVNPDNILDLACGTGYYTNSYNSKFDIYGIDLSKKAISLACKKSNNKYIIGSIFELPFYNSSFDIITLIFAPRPLEEIKRVLKKDGIFIEVIPNKNHLIELKNAIYDNTILNEVSVLNDSSLIIEDIHTVEFIMKLDKLLIKDLFNMTPYKYKTSIENINKLNNIETLDITASFIINIYKKIN